jgi:hypothetical protein
MESINDECRPIQAFSTFTKKQVLADFSIDGVILVCAFALGFGWEVALLRISSRVTSSRQD